jgi:hypothetical protein
MQQDGVVSSILQVNESELKKKTLFWIFISTANPYSRRRSGDQHENHETEIPRDYQRRLCSDNSEAKMNGSESARDLQFGGVDVVLGE